MWKILQHDRPDDFVLATGETHSVREFCALAFARVGFNLEFRGSDASEVGVDAATGKELIAVDPRYFRRAEVETLVGDAAKAKKLLGWTPKVTFAALVEMMADADLVAVQSSQPFHIEPSLERLLVVAGE
jgi:GDPmannose 4,6-dehydratase